MKDEKKNPAAGNGGVNKIAYSKLTKPKPFPQERIMWQAHRECMQRFQNDPTPVNRIIAQTIAAKWKDAFKSEVLT